jgi:hypothetical protein
MKTVLSCTSYLSLFSRYSRTRLRFQTTTYRSLWSISNKPFNMPSGTAASEQLTAKLKSMSVTSPLPEYPNCFPEVNPVDIYRAHLTSILAEVTGVDSKIIYPALQWTQTLEKGDLVLPVPALRVKGKKPDELAAEWIQKVGT